MRRPRKLKLYLNREHADGGILYMVCGDKVYYYNGFLEHWFESHHPASMFRRRAWELVGEMNEQEIEAPGVGAR